LLRRRRGRAAKKETVRRRSSARACSPVNRLGVTVTRTPGTLARKDAGGKWPSNSWRKGGGAVALLDVSWLLALPYARCAATLPGPGQLHDAAAGQGGLSHYPRALRAGGKSRDCAPQFAP